MDARDPFLASIRESNRQGRDAWGRFARHREHVQSLLTAEAAEEATLCILGAGNLNDVDLAELLGLYSEVHLVDVDTASMGVALRRHGLFGHARCSVHDAADLSGILDRLPQQLADDSAQGVAELTDAVAEFQAAIAGGPFTVTLSAGVLTQLLQSVVDSALPADDVVRVSLAYTTGTSPTSFG